MKLQLIFLALLAAEITSVSNCSSTPRTRSTTTTTTTTTTSDPCESCRNQPVSVGDTWAGQCFPYEEGASCNCLCGDVFCYNGEFIDRSTCKSDGRLQDCKCISTSTSTSTIDPTTVTATTPGSFE